MNKRLAFIRLLIENKFSFLTVKLKHNIFMSLLLAMFFILASDLLYLYFIRCWYDPNPIIEYTEVVLLFIFAIGGFILWIRSLKKLIVE
jgi:uncharacterized membrane protein